LDHLCGRVDWLKERMVKAEKEIESLNLKKTQGEARSFVVEAKEIAGKKVLLKEFKDYNMEMLRTLSDALQSELKSCVLVLASANVGKVNFLITVTGDLVQKGVSAKDLAAKFAEIVQGRSGGKESKAEGGGKDPARIQEGINAVIGWLGG